MTPIFTRSLIFHGHFDDLRQMLPPIFTSNITNTRSQIQHSSLRQSPLHKPWNICVRVSDCFQTTGNTETIEELRNSFE